MAAAQLGPITEARFAEAFASRAVIGASAAADLIGVSIQSFEALALPSVAKGRGHSRGYTEGALRSYLSALLAPAKPEQPRPPRVTRRPSSRVLRFTDHHKV